MDIVNLYQRFISESVGVTTDTRSILPGHIFFALKGDTFNGNRFAGDALAKGALLVVTDEEKTAVESGADKEKLFIADNVLHALQQMALHHRKHFSGKVIALTGSNGKTTTKELIYRVLLSSYNTFATKGNFNNHIGIPLTLLSMPQQLDFAVVEMGANHQGEIKSYCTYTEPDFGMITNVGLAHIEGFGGFQGVIKGKTELYRHLIERNQTIFLNADDEILSQHASPGNCITYGTGSKAWCRGALIETTGFLKFEVECDGESVLIQSQISGAYNFYNLLAAVCIGKYFNIGLEKIADAIQSYEPDNNRSQIIKRGTNTIYLDAYNANPSSMKAALESFAQLPAANKIVIVGEMMELGEESHQHHQEIYELVVALNPAARVFLGKGFSFLKGESGIEYYDSTTALIDDWKERKFSEATVLLKGSRANRLEAILQTAVFNM
jgi:UDP-N-acetylmuramoyl-tripeptide--D-alanyl-D-alanine ligase